MYTSEMVLILPIIIILILSIFVMFFFVVELNSFELTSGKHFLLAQYSNSKIDGLKAEKLNDQQVVISPFRTVTRWENDENVANPFKGTIGKSKYAFKSNYYWINEHRLAYLFIIRALEGEGESEK